MHGPDFPSQSTMLLASNRTATIISSKLHGEISRKKTQHSTASGKDKYAIMCIRLTMKVWSAAACDTMDWLLRTLHLSSGTINRPGLYFELFVDYILGRLPLNIVVSYKTSLFQFSLFFDSSSLQSGQVEDKSITFAV